MISGPRRLAHVGRVFFASCSVVAFVTLSLWVFGAGVVDSVDRYFVDRHVTPWTDRFDAAKAVAATDPAGAILRFEELLRGLREVQKDDRLEPIKRRSFEWITTLLRGRGAPEAGFAWAAEWVRFDDRDLNAHLERVRFLGRIGGREVEAADAFRALYTKVPEVPAVSRAYLEDRLAKGDRETAVRVVLESLVPYDLAARRDWQVFLRGPDAKDGAPRAVTPAIDANRTMRLRFAVAPGIESVRIDPPAFVDLMLTNSRLLIRRGEEELRLSFAGIKVNPVQMTQDGDTLVTSVEPDPRFIVRFPAAVRAEATVVEFAAIVGRPWPGFFAELLETPESIEVEARLVAAGEHALLERLRRARTDAARRAGLAITFPGVPPEPVRCDFAGSQVTFDTTLPVPRDAARVELSLPRIRGVVVDVEIELTTNGETRLFSREKLAEQRHRGLIESRDVEWTDDGLLVAGSSPSLTLHLDEWTSTGSTGAVMVVRGGIE